MAEKTKYYKELGLGRQRTLGLGYSLNGVPVDADHAALIEESIKEALERDRQEKNAAANQAKAASTPCRFPHQTRSSPTQGKRDFANPESSSTTDPGRNIGTANISDRVDLGRAIQIRDRDGPAEILPQNEWPVALIFNGNDYFEGKVLLDTGAADNWISERVIREKGISKEDDKDEDQFEDFNGRITKSSGVVRAIWLYRHQTINVKFRVAPQAPWEVLFGYRHLIETGVLTFHPEHNISFVAPLTKKDRTLSAAEGEQILHDEESSQNESTKVKHFLEWKKQRSAEGWLWDRKSNNFYKVTPQQTLEWCPNGYQVNFRLDDRLEAR